MRILIVEDYPPVRDAVAQALLEEGFTVDIAPNGRVGLERLKEHPYDALVVDVMMPEMSGLDMVGELRARGDTTPALLLTALDGVEDRVRGLDGGADDYMVKPFAIPELVARVRALVRRGYGARTPVVQVGPVSVDTTARTASVEGRLVPLTTREYALLEYLAMRLGQVVTREEICEHIYEERVKSSNVVDVYVGYLRRKLADAGAPPILHTRRGAGYLLSANGDGS